MTQHIAYILYKKEMSEFDMIRAMYMYKYIYGRKTFF